MEVTEKRYNKIAYVLAAFFLGELGIHSFIAGKPIQGVLFIIMSLIGWSLSVIFIGFFIIGIIHIIIFVQIIMALLKSSDEYGRIA